MVKILIVDDQEDYLRSLARALCREFDIHTVTSLEEACSVMSEAYQVALVDVRLSETDFDNRDGVRFLEHSKERFPNVPVLMMSAYSDFDAAVGALNLGADYFLKKPIDLRELKHMLREFASGTRPEATEALRERLGERRK